jgi:hypothetical protein
MNWHKEERREMPARDVDSENNRAQGHLKLGTPLFERFGKLKARQYTGNVVPWSIEIDEMEYDLM